MSVDPTEAAPESEVLISIDGPVATITLHRPDRLNALTPRMGAAYAAALRTADSDPAVRVAVVTGAGRGFCSGADLSLLGQGPQALDTFVSDERDSPTIAADVDIPVVMAVNGPAAGLGFVIAMTGDVVFAGPHAKFISAFSRLGLVAEYGIAWLLPRRVGAARAAEILLSGRAIDADEALSLGLVSAVEPDPLAAAQAWAHDVATHCSPRSLAIIKGQLREAATQDAVTAVARSRELMIDSFRGPDLPEALIAKVEGRAPRFAD